MEEIRAVSWRRMMMMMMAMVTIEKEESKNRDIER
jgi:hypothetical protein